MCLILEPEVEVCEAEPALTIDDAIRLSKIDEQLIGLHTRIEEPVRIDLLVHSIIDFQMATSFGYIGLT